MFFIILKQLSIFNIMLASTLNRRIIMDHIDYRLDRQDISRLKKRRQREDRIMFSLQIISLVIFLVIVYIVWPK